MRRVLATAVVVVIALGVIVIVTGRAPIVEVSAEASLQKAIDEAPTGATLRLESGEHQGGVVVDKSLTLRADDGATLVAPPDEEVALAIRADDVHLESLEVRGAVTGISIREAEGVELQDVVVSGAELHGIEVVDASALIEGAHVSAMRSRYSQSIEVRYADNHPETVVRGTTIEGGREGIVSHVAEVLFEDNVVSDTTLRGIAVTEMSHGVVRGNLIEDAAGAGLYCGDMSMCEFSNNSAEDVASIGSGSAAGWGLVVNYESRASSNADVLSGAAGPSESFYLSELRRRSPFDLGSGIGAVPRIALATVLALAGLAFTTWVTFLVVSRGGRRSTLRHAGAAAWRWVTPVLLVALAVQSFHLVEHMLQVYRVHVDGVPSKGGIVGPVVEAEWIHFIYNTSVFAGIAAVAIARRRGWRPGTGLVWGDSLMGAAVVLQGYHVVEHSAKLYQHLTTGSKVNPGVLGGETDLVLFHYAINLAVYVAFLGGTALYLARARRTRAGELRPGPSALPAG